MNEGTDYLVLWILLPIFMALGVYLAWYSLRRKKMLESFAEMHSLRMKPEYREELERILDKCFSLKKEGLVRSFGQLSSIINGGSVWIFRAVELIDNNPHGQSEFTHFARIVALFDISPDYEEFFLLSKSMQVTQRIPGAGQPDPKVIELVKRVVVDCNARHVISVTLRCGYGLIYFEPLVTGGERLNDIDALYTIARNMCENLCSKPPCDR